MEASKTTDSAMSQYRWEQLSLGLTNFARCCHEVFGDRLTAPNVSEGTFPDESCPNFTQEEIEAASRLIDLLNYSYGRGLRIVGALRAKFEFIERRSLPPRKEST